MVDHELLAPYLDRIGCPAPAAPDLAGLRAIVAAHAASVPFENIDVLLGRGARLDLPALAGKLVAGRRGGYCFEQNTLLMGALRALGFTVEGLAARVVWLRPVGTIGPRTHMLLRVALPDSAYLVDVGFGGLTLTAPLRFAPHDAQETPHEPHRLIPCGGDALELQARFDGAWTPLYRLTPEPQHPIDYEVANWFTATHPDGLFTNNLMCARPDPDCRYALLNTRLTIRRRGAPAERRELRDAGELAEMLARYFHLDLPPGDVALVWAKIAARQPLCPRPL